MFFPGIKKFSKIFPATKIYKELVDTGLSEEECKV